MGVNDAFIPFLFVMEIILSITSWCWSWRSTWLSPGMVALASNLRRVVVVLVKFMLDAVVVMAFLVDGLLDGICREGLSRVYGLLCSIVFWLVVVALVLVRFCVICWSLVLVDLEVFWLVGKVLSSLVWFRVVVSELLVRSVMVLSVVLGSVVLCFVEARVVVSLSVIMMSWSVR